MDAVNIRPDEMLLFQKLLVVFMVLFFTFLFATLVAAVSLFLGITQMLRTGSIRNGVVVVSIWFSLLIALLLCGLIDIALLISSAWSLSTWQLILLNVGGSMLFSFLISNLVKLFLFQYLAEMQLARRILDYVKIMYEKHKRS